MGLSRRAFVRRVGGVGAVAAAFGPIESAARPASLPGEVSSGFGGSSVMLREAGNPYGPSARVLDSLRSSLDRIHQNERTGVDALLDTIAAAHRVERDHVVLGCGSTSVLQATVRVFSGSRRPLVAARPASDLITRVAGGATVEIVAVPLTEDSAHDLEAMLACSTRTPGMVYICNPNTPTGTLTPRRDLDRFLDRLPRNVTVIVDEAYHQYADPAPDTVSLVDRAANDARVIVTRTFSKAFGLSALRVGYAIAGTETARLLAAQGLADGVSSWAARAATAALTDREYLELTLERNRDDRQEFQNQVNARMLRSLDSQANFVLLDTGRDAEAVVEHFGHHAVALAAPIAAFPRQLRVPIGREDEMRAFWRVWDLMPRGPMIM